MTAKWHLTDPDTFVAVAIDALDPKNVYAGIRTGGILKSSDGGDTWAAADTGLTDPRITTLAVDPRDSRILYASTAGGVFRSADGASTWQRFNLGLGPYGVNAFAIDPAGRSVYAGGQPGRASMPPTGIEPVHAV